MCLINPETEEVKRLLFLTVYPPLFLLCVLGVYTKGTILSVRPD